jgi:hypothetical protein
MNVEQERIGPETRRKIQELMRVNAWSFEKALNEILMEAVASGATSVVGRRKAKVLQLVTPMRASGRDS